MTDIRTTQAHKRVLNPTYAIVAIASVAALLPFLDKSVWRDEGATLYSSRLSWSALWHESLVDDRVLLPYYAFLHLWLNVSFNIEWARLPSLLSYGLIVYLVGILARRIAGFWCGLISVGLACTNPLLITAALDARPYEIATLASLLSVAALLRWIDRGELNFFWLFSILAISTAMLQLFSVLAPLSALGACLILSPQKFRRDWRRVIAPIAVLGAAVVGFLGLVAHQQGQVAWIPGLGFRLFAGDLEGPASPAGGHLIYAIVLGIIGLLSLVVCLDGVRRRTLRLPRSDVSRLVVFTSMAAVPTVVLVLITAVKPVYVDRYVTASVPGMAIAVALLVTYAFRALGATTFRPGRTLIVVAAALSFAIAAANAVAVSRAPLVDDLKGAAQYISSAAGPSSEVAIPGHFLTGGVEYYLDRDDSTLPLWPQKSGHKFDPTLVLRESDRTFADAQNNVWLVNDSSVDGTKGFISRLYSHGFTRVSTESFDGVRVLHFHRNHSG